MFSPNRSLDALQPKMKTAVMQWLDLCHNAGIQVLITETKRSKARQLFLWAKGRILSKGVEIQYLGYDDPNINSSPKERQVTWTLQSKHIEGLAIDFGFMTNGVFNYNGDWSKAWDLAEKAGLKSLFRSNGIDKPHLEYHG